RAGMVVEHRVLGAEPERAVGGPRRLGQAAVLVASPGERVVGVDVAPAGGLESREAQRLLRAAVVVGVEEGELAPVGRSDGRGDLAHVLDARVLALGLAGIAGGGVDVA